MLRFAATLLEPGARLMLKLRMPVKMALMAMMLVAPLLLMIGISARQVLNDLAYTRSERAGAELVGGLRAIVLEVQAHRGLTNRVLAGDTAATAARDEARVRLARAVATADAQLSLPLPFAADDAWPALRTALQAIAQGRHPERRTEAFAAHTALVEQLRLTVQRIGERSGLLLDPEAASFFLMDLAVERLIPWTETLGQARGQGAALLARGDASNTERAWILGRAEGLEAHTMDLEFRIGALVRAGVAQPPAWPAAKAASRAFSQRTIAIFGAEVIEGDAGPYFDAGTQAIDLVRRLSDHVDASLVAELQQRERRLHRLLALELGSSLLGLSLLAYLFAAFYRSFSASLGTLQAGVQALASGNLAHRVRIGGRDELADIGSILEGMGDKLSAMVAEIRSSAVRVGQSGQQVADSGEALSQRTEAQAASLRQTVCAVGQLSAAVAQNAQAAQDLDQLTSRLRADAEGGGAAMQQTVASMAQLKTSSQRVGEIVGVIDSIAFQTNILALNAAVEAARAGEAGRGFAVVATEVRQLAQRSAQASAEIRQLIAHSSEQVTQSVGRIQQVSITLDTVVDGVRAVSQSLRGIAQASTQQSTGLQEVSQSVGSLDEITRQNQAMVAESGAASADLVVRAAALSAAVAAMRLRQGGADEARHLVDQAVKLVRERGLDAAARAFRDPNGGFVDRDLYIFVTDREGRYHVHGARPAMEGHRVHEVPGIDGDRFARESWAATEGAGWVEYSIINPDTGRVQPKASCVARLDDRLLLGCGIYRPVPTGVGAAAAPDAAAPDASSAASSAAKRAAPRAPVVARAA